MKNITLTILFFISIVSCFGQSMFFDNLNGSTWISASNITDSTIKELKEISLRKLTFSKDSLTDNVTIWNFKDGLLKITYFDFSYKTEIFVVNYTYEINTDENIIKIIMNDKNLLKYSIGIVSIGNFAVLIKTKEKKTKERTPNN